MWSPAKRSLVLTIDAFGTLIKPRIPIVDQYKQEAAKFGVQLNSMNQVDKLIAHEHKKVYKQVQTRYPNHGSGHRTVGFKEWWYIVINQTLQPFINGKIPKELTSALFERFSSSEGYVLHPDVLPFLNSISSHNPPWRYPPLVTIPPNGTPPVDTPITILGILANGDPHITMILESLGIARYFSFQNLSYSSGYEKPSREAFRDARQTGLRIGKGDPNYTTKDPVSKIEVRRNLLGWDFIHVGDDISHDWCAARKVMDIQPVWLDRAGMGLNQGEAMAKFIRRKTDGYPLQMPHMAEGMKDWGKQKWGDNNTSIPDASKPKSKSTISPTAEELQNELMNSTITSLTELPRLFPYYDIPPETEDNSSLLTVLQDPDQWGDNVRRLSKAKERKNRETLRRVSQLSWSERKRYWEQRKDWEQAGGQEKEKQRIPVKYQVGRDRGREDYPPRYSNGGEEISGISGEAFQPRGAEWSSGKGQWQNLGTSEERPGGRRDVSNIEQSRKSAKPQETQLGSGGGITEWGWYW